MKNLLRAAVLLFAGEVFAFSPMPDEGFIPDVGEAETYRVESDTLLFYRAIYETDDLYGRLTDFNLPNVSLRRRGERYDAERTYVEGLGVDWRYRQGIAMLGAGEYGTAGLFSAEGLACGMAGIAAFGFDAPMPHRRYRVQVRTTDRYYRVGARVAALQEWGDGWRGAFAVDARTGRDMHVEGLFTNALTASLHVGKVFGAGHRAGIAALVPVSKRGTRLSSVEESFSLTGDRMYNPAWGFQDGRVRNSRIRSEALPMILAHYDGDLSDAVALRVAAGVEFGHRGYTSLGWYNATTPMPDNYRKMPSYAGDAVTYEVWRSDDTRYTQIAWDELILANRMAAGDARYALEERVERPVVVTASAVLTTRINDRLKLHIGVGARSENVRKFKQMRDLLGAEYLTDIDYFLVDDRTLCNYLQNNLQEPDRRIVAGDRFGYDYTMRRREASVRGEVDWRLERGRLRLAAMFGGADIRRTGHYEKELFAGRESLGNSVTTDFALYGFDITAGWNLTPSSTIHAALHLAAEAPEAEALFFQPQYRNLTVPYAAPERSMGAEVRYRLVRPRWQLQATAYLTQRLDAMTAFRYFDDLSGVYADLSAVGIGTVSAGAEVAAEWRVGDRWRIHAAASAGRARYNRDPELTIRADAENVVIDSRAVSRMGGCDVGGVPRVTALLGATWFGEKGWGSRLSCGYLAGRRVEPSLLRRTARVTEQAATTPEAFEAFTGQERLRDAVALDLWLYKRFTIGHSQLAVSLSLRNLTADRAQYSGYESTRIRRVTSGDEDIFVPHATRYTYVYPRSFYLSISYNF